MKFILPLALQFLFFNTSHANSSYCQDYMENGIFNPIFYPDLWTMDANGKFKKNASFLNNDEFKEQGTIEEKADKIIITKKFIPTVPITKTEIDLDQNGKIIKINSFQVSSGTQTSPILFSSYEFRYTNNKCYPYEEWDENSGTIYNTEFCNEAKPILQAHYKKRKQKKSEDDDEKEDKNLKLSNLLSELIKKHGIKYKDGNPYLETIDVRAKKQSNDPSSIIIEKTLMITKVCKEMDGVSRALNDSSLFNQATQKKEILTLTTDKNEKTENSELTPTKMNNSANLTPTAVIPK
jgi:hypothetical protein